MPDQEQDLGSAVRPIVRRGDAVWRPMHPWSPVVHELLAHLESVGFPAPRLLDVVGDQEVLSFLPGDSGPGGWAQVVPEDGLRAYARFLRDYHDAVAGFRPAGRFFRGEPVAPGQIVCHGDFGPWNVVFRDGRPVGLLDFDYALPGPPSWDIGYALQYVAPFRPDDECLEWLRYPTPPDRARRMLIFADAYGDEAPSTPAALAGLVLGVMREDIPVVTALAESGREPQVTWVREGHLDELRARLDWAETFASSHA
jgi:Ser/Thr protein kinase RdoA (MazF antagonist)